MRNVIRAMNEHERAVAAPVVQRIVEYARLRKEAEQELVRLFNVLEPATGLPGVKFDPDKLEAYTEAPAE